MKAKRIDGQAVNGKRTVLSNVLPLDTPYAVTIFPIYACNFKCNYCLHSLTGNARGHISDKISMDFDLYKKCIDDIATFPRKLKVLHFIGYGEPLLHHEISKMVAYAVEKKVADVVDIVTNGALLTPTLSKELISAGLTSLRISIQGVSNGKYKEVTGVDIDFEKFVDNIRYFYQQKGNAHLHIKIINSAIDKRDERKFIEIFSGISDTIAIENLVPVNEKVNYTKVTENTEYNTNILGNTIIHSEICPQPFYFMQINPDGKCVPCCNSEYPICLGDCSINSVKEIWNNKETNRFRKLQLQKKKSNNEICAKCQQYKYNMFPEEVLDNKAESLLSLYE